MQNHRDIAEAIREAGVAREDVFITTKIGPHQVSVRSSMSRDDDCKSMNSHQGHECTFLWKPRLLRAAGGVGSCTSRKKKLLVQQGEGKARLVCEEALQSLCSGYVDLLLIHWPGVVKTGLDSQRNAIKRMETWSVMEDFYRSGRCRAIGVSNYEERHLLELMQSGRVKPMVNQVYFSVPLFPFLNAVICIYF
jgi:diketogulonate reductase-like aldo/keto reductase